MYKLATALIVVSLVGLTYGGLCARQKYINRLDCAGLGLKAYPIPHDTVALSWVIVLDLRRNDLVQVNEKDVVSLFPSLVLVDLRENPINCPVDFKGIKAVSDCPLQSTWETSVACSSFLTMSPSLNPKPQPSIATMSTNTSTLTTSNLTTRTKATTTPTNTSTSTLTVPSPPTRTKATTTPNTSASTLTVPNPPTGTNATTIPLTSTPSPWPNLTTTEPPQKDAQNRGARSRLVATLSVLGFIVALALTGSCFWVRCKCAAFRNPNPVPQSIELRELRLFTSDHSSTISPASSSPRSDDELVYGQRD